jgi:hypothetical protein
VVAAEPDHLDDPVNGRDRRAKRCPYNERPAVLDDPEWLALVYERSSAAAIAQSLDINPQMVAAAMKRHGTSLRSRREEQRRRNQGYPSGASGSVGVAPSELTSKDDRDWFAGTSFHKHVRARIERVGCDA